MASHLRQLLLVFLTRGYSSRKHKPKSWPLGRLLGEATQTGFALKRFITKVMVRVGHCNMGLRCLFFPSAKNQAEFAGVAAGKRRKGRGQGSTGKLPESLGRAAGEVGQNARGELRKGGKKYTEEMTNKSSSIKRRTKTGKNPKAAKISGYLAPCI